MYANKSASFGFGTSVMPIARPNLSANEIGSPADQDYTLTNLGHALVELGQLGDHCRRLPQGIRREPLAGSGPINEPEVDARSHPPCPRDIEAREQGAAIHIHLSEGSKEALDGVVLETDGPELHCGHADPPLENSRAVSQ